MGIWALKADERVTGVAFTADSRSVTLMDGRTISVPLVWYPRLLPGSPEQRSNWKISGGGYGIHWPDLDEDRRPSAWGARSSSPHQSLIHRNSRWPSVIEFLPRHADLRSRGRSHRFTSGRTAPTSRTYCLVRRPRPRSGAPLSRGQKHNCCCRGQRQKPAWHRSRGARLPTHRQCVGFGF